MGNHMTSRPFKVWDGSVWIDVSGSQGPQGIQGIQGIQGEQGVAGFSVLNGSGPPGGGVGVNGDFYINTSTWDIYGPKTGGAWGSPTSLIGPQGPAVTLTGKTWADF